tara:strand:- start:713 stop:898 length:186 start_codon:yes stop_codon:yes gene_type:complete
MLINWERFTVRRNGKRDIINNTAGMIISSPGESIFAITPSMWGLQDNKQRLDKLKLGQVNQ